MSQSEESKHRLMTTSLQRLWSDEEVADYIRWIIKSDTAKEYYATIHKKEIEEMSKR